MDPNANLQEQERILTRRMEPGAPERDPVAGQRLQALRLALAGWLNAGGAAPDWGRAPRASRFYRIYINQVAYQEYLKDFPHSDPRD